MGIAPIDLQTLFSQVDKVGKAQAAQREGQALHQAILGVQLQKKTEEHIQQVNEAQNTGDGTEKVGDQKQGQGGGNKEKSKNKREAQEEENPVSVLRDPTLGNTIDISL